MRLGIRASRFSAMTGWALLLGTVPVALVVAGSDVVFGQSGIESLATTPSFIAVDLNPRGFANSWASGISNGYQVGGGSGPVTGDQIHPLLWRGSPASATDLHPSGFKESLADGLSGGEQVGDGAIASPQGAYPTHALLWRGGADSVVDLHPQPSEFIHSSAAATSGGQQVGYGIRSYTEDSRALLWRGSAATVVKLHPSGFIQSFAVGVAGGEQVGYGDIGSPQGGGSTHALLWRGSADSVVDLHPRGFSRSQAVATSGREQVGYGDILSPQGNWSTHALLWRGSADSVADLHPPAFSNSWAVGTSGGKQVGYADPPNGDRHALLWLGAAGVVDLNAFLPPGFVGATASGIDSTGDIVGVAWGPASQNRSHAFLWTRKRTKSNSYLGQHTIRYQSHPTSQTLFTTAARGHPWPILSRSREAETEVSVRFET